ncbi:MAG: copper resistance protein CopC/CopD, partial [Actinomycetota bacterium]|nr:copper resistance protein CopC/CopD [Actinomycetota bacterium]
MLALGSGEASAHAFLVSSDPAQGARLARAPTAIIMTFSEHVASSGTTVTVGVVGRPRPLPATLRHTAGSNVVHVALSGGPNGVYVIAWRTVSADDGHISEGEFAFAIGNVAGAVPRAAQGGTSPDPVRVAATVLFLFGFALAAGGTVTGLAVDRSVTTRSPGVRMGLVAALAGAMIAFVDIGAGHGTGLSRAGLLAGLAALAAGGAMFASGVSRRRLPVLIALLAAGVVWAAEGHPAIDGGPVGLAINAVHLTLGTLWVGTLGYLTVAVVRSRSDRDAVVGVARRYSRLALPLVVVVGATGGLSAVEVLPSWSSLWSSGYGQLIVAKTVLFAGALGLAVWNRRRGVRRRRSRTLLRVVPAESAAVGAILVLTAVLVNAAAPVAAQSETVLLGPPPLSGLVARDAGLAGQLNVSVADGSGQLQVQVSAPDSTPIVAHVDVNAMVPDGQDVGLFLRPCGNGCFTEAFRPPNGATTLSVAARAHGWEGGVFRAHIDWPPAPADPQLLAQVITSMGTAPVVAGTETVTSNTARPPSVQVLPPISGASLMALEPYGPGREADQRTSSSAVTDVRPLTSGGTGLGLYLPGEPILVTIRLDSQGRIRTQRIVDSGHVITDTFTYPS